MVITDRVAAATPDRVPSRDAAESAESQRLGPPEIGELYRTLAQPLERIVRLGIHAPDPLIEDACQFAWTRLVAHQARIHRETVLAWLVKTAQHEAFKLARRGGRDQSLEAELAERGEIPALDPRPGPAEVCQQLERLGLLMSLAPRQRRQLWMYGLGLSYREIATHDGCTARTVERQLQRARATLRAAEG